MIDFFCVVNNDWNFVITKPRRFHPDFTIP